MASKEQIEREALEMYPVQIMMRDKKPGHIGPPITYDFNAPKRKVHVKARMQSLQELSDLHEQLAEVKAYRKLINDNFGFSEGTGAGYVINEIVGLNTAIQSGYDSLEEDENKLKVTEAQLKALQEADRWISVDYSHPEDVTKIYSTVLIYDGLERDVCMYSHIEKRFATDRKVTHWRLLPKSPLEG